MVGVDCFSIQWVFVICENVIIWVVVLLKKQFCGYPSFKWDLEKNEKKLFQFFQRGSPERKRVMWVVGLTDNLILWVVGLNSN